jgi:Flp pilus assembly protein TadG
MSMNLRLLVQQKVVSRSRRQVVIPLVSLTVAERGASLAEFALLLPFLSLLLLGVIDFGRAYYLGIEVSNAAYAGALYGSQNPSDTKGMQNAATGDAPDVSGMTVTATYGCECSDGTSPVTQCTSQPTCTINVVNYVQVTTSATYRTLLPWPGIPSSFALQGKARLRASQ